MGFFDRLFGMRAQNAHEDSAMNDSENECLTFEEAKEIATRDAKRDLKIDPAEISYIAYEEGFCDFCKIVIFLEGPNKGDMTAQALPLSDRLADETITDARIREVAESGNLIAAVRLFRLLHSADLKTAKDGVERLMAS
ncbi:MAG: hypothetical protein ACIAXF_16645 [Phycisphaerales bacterium JB063]